jgi:hypothetical protein
MYSVNFDRVRMSNNIFFFFFFFNIFDIHLNDIFFCEKHLFTPLDHLRGSNEAIAFPRLFHNRLMGLWAVLSLFKNMNFFEIP